MMFKATKSLIVSILSITFGLVILQSCGEEDTKSNDLYKFFESYNGSNRDNYVVPVKDPFMDLQWHLLNSGQTAYALNNGLISEDINHAPVRQLKYTGLGVTVAISDNGTEETHPDLRARIFTPLSRNYTSSNPGLWSGKSSDNGGTSGQMAHGTATAGLIGAVDGNGIGVSGVAPRSILVPFLYVGTSGSNAKDLDQQNGPFDIFNYSYGRSTCDFVHLPTAQIEQYKYGVENLRNGLGAIYVKAAGNEYIAKLTDCRSGLQGNYYGNANLEEDQSTPYVLTVGSVNASGYSSSYSSPGSSLWLSAYGGEFGQVMPAIVTTDTTGCDKGMASMSEAYNDFDLGLFGNSSCDYTATMNGTSAAAPIVSGSVAIILETNPALSWRDVKYILAKTARQVDPTRGPVGHPEGANLPHHTYQEGWTVNANNYPFHNWYGFGVIDLKAAVLMAENYQDNDYLPPLIETQWVDFANNLNLAIPDANPNGVEHTISISTELQIFSLQIMFSIQHTYSGDLGIELTSPSGTKSILLNINSGILETNINDGLLLSNAFLGETSKGQWTIKFIDGASNDLGIVTGWKINFFGTPLDTMKKKSINNNFEQNIVNSEMNSRQATLFQEAGNQYSFLRDVLTKSRSEKNAKKTSKNVLSIKKKIKTYTVKLLESSKDILYPDKKNSHLSNIIDAKFSKHEIIELHKRTISGYNKENKYKICSQNKYLTISRDGLKITYSELGKETKKLDFKHTINIKFLKCNSRYAYFKDNSKLISLSLTSLASSTRLFFNAGSNLYFNKIVNIEETLDEKFNLTYAINQQKTSFPEGHPQLKVIQSKGHISSYVNDEKKEQHVIITNATSKVTDIITNKESPLILLFEKNKIQAILQLSQSWQLRNGIKLNKIIDLDLKQGNNVSILYRDHLNNYRVIEITLNNLTLEALNGK
jgi:subtilisin-like proprotein convertase family protein